MMEQIDLFDDVYTEEQVFDVLLPSLKEGLKKNNAGCDNCRCIKRNLYSSVVYVKCDPYYPEKELATPLAFRICLRDGLHYFGVSNAYIDNIPDEFKSCVTDAKPSSGFTNFEFEPTKAGIEKFSEFLTSVFVSVTYDVQKEFDCCSRVEQCSDARKCIHPNPAMATSCGYRKMLKEGKIFYGKNRNEN